MTPLAQLRLLHVGDWPCEAVSATWSAHGARLIVPEVEAIIERTWAAVRASGRTMLFDGPMCRLEEVRASPSQISLAFSPTSYKPFLGTNLSRPELADEYGVGVLANPVGVSTALETADRFLLLGIRNDRVAYYPSRIHPFAGALEPGDVPRLFDAVRRELREELNLGPEAVGQLRCTGLVEDSSLRQPELIFRAMSSRNRAAIEAQVDPAEHQGSWAVAATPHAVQKALADDRLTPVARAALALWGRARLGEAWFLDLTRARDLRPS